MVRGSIAQTVNCVPKTEWSTPAWRNRPASRFRATAPRRFPAVDCRSGSDLLSHVMAGWVSSRASTGLTGSRRADWPGGHTD